MRSFGGVYGVYIAMAKWYENSRGLCLATPLFTKLFV